MEKCSSNYRVSIFPLCYFLSSFMFEERLHHISEHKEMSIKSVRHKYAAYIYGQEGVRNLLFHLTNKQI